MTRGELLAGLRRLALVTLGLAAAALVVSEVFVLLGSARRAALAGGTGTVGIILVFGGVAAFARTRPVRELRPSRSEFVRSSIGRREIEHLALGLLTYGITFSVVALVLG